MSDNSAIQWTDATWNPTTGCTKVSPGCAHCYIERTPAFRINGRKFVNGATDLRLHADRLEQPLHWRKPRRVFVNSLSDLFHADVPDAFIGRVFAVMSAARQHTFQVLTKRPERMRALMTQYPEFAYPNVWLGVSVENQHFADERIPLLLDTPAAVRFISAEPLLGPVTFRWAMWDDHAPHQRRANQLPPVDRDGKIRAGSVDHLDGLRMLDWVIVGGESGPGSRPFDLAWARAIVQQCQAAGVACFVKQLGANPRSDRAAEDFPRIAGINRGWRRDRPDIGFSDRKGGDPAEWPADLQIRAFPAVRA